VRWPIIALWLASIAVAGLVLLPVAYLALRAASAGPQALELLTRASTMRALANTVLLVLTVTGASITIGVPMAWLIERTDLPFRRAWGVLTALPLVLPSYVAAYLLVSVFGPRGVAQQLLSPLTGVDRLPAIYGFPGAFLALTLMCYPYVLLTARAGLRRLDPGQAEAARSLGHSSWSTFWRVTLPQLRPATMAGALLVALYVLRDFGAVTMLRYDTFTRIIYVQYRSFLDRSLAATTALLLVGVTGAVLYLELRTRGRAAYARRSTGAPRRLRRITLGRWRWPALAAVGLLVFVALLLPAISLAYWLSRGDVLAESFRALGSATVNSTFAALLAALLSVIAALPVAVLAVRRPSRRTNFLERVTYVGHALPGIVIALALVFLGANYLPRFYQTLPLLLVAYVILFVPQAVGAARTSLLQVPPSLEEAGRALGHRPWQVFRQITLPLLRPGLLAGGGLVFLTCLKELPATLLLSPAGFDTLSGSVWSYVSEAFFARAAAPTLVLLLLSSIPLAVLTLRDR
jgi:iron(III) transport system permease protein